MGEWANGFCGCFNDCTLCVITYFAPCYTAGKNAEGVGDSCIMVGLLYWFINPVGVFFAAKVRGKIREQFGIEVSRNKKIHSFLSSCHHKQQQAEYPALKMVNYFLDIATII